MARNAGRFYFDGGAASFLGTGIIAALITICTFGMGFPFALVLLELLLPAQGSKRGSSRTGPVAVVVRVRRGADGVAGYSGRFLAGTAGAQRRRHDLGCAGHRGELGPLRW